MKKNTMKMVIFCLVFSFFSKAFSNQYSLLPESQSLIGDLQFTSIGSNENIASVAKRYDIGYNAIENLNPQIKNGDSSGSIQIATMHLLPPARRYGVVVNLPEMRMYYFKDNMIYTYPIGIGKVGKTIPIQNTSVIKKTENPKWIPTSAIREYNLNKGIVLPEVMLPGPNNPLGNYAIYLGIPTYLMHSTIYPESVGTRASFGCIRMYESDVKELFSLIAIGTSVSIRNEPTKVGFGNNQQLYLEVHPPLEEHRDSNSASLQGIIHMISNTSNNHNMLIDWQQAYFIEKTRDGIPHAIGILLSSSY